ncbi:hypothetical protein JAAARDRAFT_198255 [Jaapia argillacea MUCL 33604]|uniref:Uncharacterized protein n=1 Tax=Jaapia argillacea MUCL 33604 TaxID=933084 RepID=A0A067PM70_9AGAM|nr:hypothetical protein JAAARDRAFT_198255 [Jaapia argillacea MUCL 33604]
MLDMVKYPMFSLASKDEHGVVTLLVLTVIILALVAIFCSVPHAPPSLPVPGYARATSRSVFDYLVKTQVQRLKPRNPKPGRNTVGKEYSFADIKGVHPWADFTFDDIMQSPMPSTSLAPWCHVNHRHARGASPTKRHFISGGTARQMGSGLPDRAGRPSDDTLDLNDSPNRAPGEIKVSWKWKAKWIHKLPEEFEGVQYRQVLSQELCYMRCHGTRDGYVLTHKELICLRRRPGAPGHLDVSAPIPMHAYCDQLSASAGPMRDGVFPHATGQLTVLLGLWYIHMLASDDSGWCLK